MNTTEPFTREPGYDYFCTDQEKAACIINGEEEVYVAETWIDRTSNFKGYPLGMGATDLYRRRHTTSWIPLSERKPTTDDMNGWECILLLDTDGTVSLSCPNVIHKEATHWLPIPKEPIKTQGQKDHALWLDRKDELYVKYRANDDRVDEFFFKAGLKAGRESLK